MLFCSKNFSLPNSDLIGNIINSPEVSQVYFACANNC